MLGIISGVVLGANSLMLMTYFYDTSMRIITQSMVIILILKRDLNQGLCMSHRVNYEAAALTTRPPRLDSYLSVISCLLNY